ncbi:glycerophosphodiester phosphodiesterase family protein [Agrobacterium vitis]|uniref:glycerophosphodiester phosphodiesterase family protein n=1 Tax=Agrobacterium vitis TaxID=373 RepID=UPI0015736ED4|nr:glycerophosphodiester phosphodiesterase family protein [Agrobacterium vitis]NSZ19999.1 glycerophosphodiester phosphodiesterase [Agrobacterium vitis]QZO07392.1 glycerophosphodiester phosphodiesterase [Agrobacterium vitis]UJL90885.1 glycerophosphodiester phosphodiesterase [Agrobacterium vitis]
MSKALKKISISLLILVAVVSSTIFLLNTNLLAARPAGEPILLAHRGIAPRYDMTNVKSDTCTATRMLPSGDVFVENTIASMKASFEAGADAVEFDIHPTTDGEFAVFHDWTLDCRTDGHGVTREHAMTDLRKLDVGYGYTADGGKTFPFRGKGIGLMPTVKEVLETFPGKRFLVNIKSNDPKEGDLFASYLKAFPAEVTDKLFVYGGERPIAKLKALMPGLKTTTRVSAMACLKEYAKWGWTSIVPSPCKNGVVYIPINMAPDMWGWPYRLLDRIRDAGSEVFIIGPYHGGNYSNGVDTIADLKSLPDDWSGGLMTNELELLAPAMGRKQ